MLTLCSGDKPLTAALEIIYNEGITSLPVLDNHQNVVGNISYVDVRVRFDDTVKCIQCIDCSSFLRKAPLLHCCVELASTSYPLSSLSEEWTTVKMQSLCST